MEYEPSSETSPMTPEAELAMASRKPALDINKLILSGSIVLAALLVSGTLLYVNYNGKSAAADQASFNLKDVKKWATKVGVNGSHLDQCLDDTTALKAEIQKDLADGTRAGVSGTPSFLINNQLIVGAQPFGTFEQTIEAELKNLTDKNTAVEYVDDDPVLGQPNAPVTIVEFSDFQCPFCRTFWQDTFSQLKEKYIDTGKARLVFRDFPLSFHPGAEPMAEVAACAHAQGKFWEFHDRVFSEQGKLGSGTITFSL